MTVEVVMDLRVGAVHATLMPDEATGGDVVTMLFSVNLCMYECMYVTYVCMYVCMHVCMYAHTYMHAIPASNLCGVPRERRSRNRYYLCTRKHV